MAGSGSEKRQATKIAGTRLTPEEHAHVLAESERSGIAISDRIRAALLDDPAPRARPQPTVNRIETARLTAQLGELAQALRDAAKTGDQGAVSAQIEAAHRDIADMCLLSRQALGKRP